ncbi:MAG TPA: carboxypeptidase regulatory-like domain-containing protein, partial [Bryobacteraceae bacterium]|nr:carboxypeptidase regulatory-like domain-containing protein [Bryobacteraceae bacterium]
TFQPVRDANGNIVGISAASGDYNADGVNNDYPNVASYSMGNGRHDYLTGVFPKSNFTQPTLGTEGNEKWGQFRNPGFAETDASLSKDTNITERLRLQLRFEFYNVFNRVNLGGVQANLSSSTFSRSTSQLPPRNIQIGAKIMF